MCSRSTSTSRELWVAAFRGFDGTAIVRDRPVAVIIARSITLRSSRMLPGHECRPNAARLSGVTESTRLPNALENSSMNRQISGGRSSRR